VSKERSPSKTGALIVPDVGSHQDGEAAREPMETFLARILGFFEPEDGARSKKVSLLVNEVSDH